MHLIPLVPYLYVNWAEESIKSKEVVDGTTSRDELMQTEIQKIFLEAHNAVKPTTL